MKRPVATAVAIFMLSILPAPVFLAADAHLYIAVFSDGNILEGNHRSSFTSHKQGRGIIARNLEEFKPYKK